MAMHLSMEADISLKLGYLELSHCRVGPSSDALVALYADAANAAGERFSNAPLAEDPVAAGVRSLFKSVGIDPSRYRPSGEALVRRIVKGQGLFHINCIVDINNVCSIETLFPLGTYDRDRISGNVAIRLGREDEVYRGIGKEINISGKLVSADSEGAFGSPIADSDRTKITSQTNEILVLLYAPVTVEDCNIHNTLNRFAGLAEEYAGAQSVNSGIQSSF
jgi:DNA/RNA-binding domain of Phe-tRNA-synthetase-like protein